MFELNSGDAEIKDRQVNYETAKVVIETNPDDKTWLLKSLIKTLTVDIATPGQLELVSVSGAANNTGAVFDALLIQNNMELVGRLILKKSGIKNACSSVVAEDFDNDMDIDIYLVCSRPTGNLPNIYLDNQGDGIFSVVDLGGGAEGHLQAIMG